MQVPVGKDFRVSAASVARAITRNTVLMVASSPCFPHGVIDDVEGIAKVSLWTYSKTLLNRNMSGLGMGSKPLKGAA